MKSLFRKNSESHSCTIYGEIDSFIHFDRIKNDKQNVIRAYVAIREQDEFDEDLFMINLNYDYDKTLATRFYEFLNHPKYILQEEHEAEQRRLNQNLPPDEHWGLSPEEWNDLPIDERD